MQRTLLIANTLLIVAVGALVLPLFMDVHDLRERVDAMPTGEAADPRLEALNSTTRNLLAVTDHVIEQNDAFREWIDQSDERASAQQSAIERLTQELATVEKQLARAMNEAANRAPEPSTEPKRVELPPAINRSLAGDWRMTMPKGYQVKVTLQEIDATTLRLTGAYNMNGVYQLKNNQLVVTEPKDKRLTEFVWQIDSPYFLRLIVAPPTSKIGSDYTGTTLSRQAP